MKLSEVFRRILLTKANVMTPCSKTRRKRSLTHEVAVDAIFKVLRSVTHRDAMERFGIGCPLHHGISTHALMGIDRSIRGRVFTSIAGELVWVRITLTEEERP